MTLVSLSLLVRTRMHDEHAANRHFHNAFHNMLCDWNHRLDAMWKEEISTVYCCDFYHTRNIFPPPYLQLLLQTTFQTDAGTMMASSITALVAINVQTNVMGIQTNDIITPKYWDPICHFQMIYFQIFNDTKKEAYCTILRYEWLIQSTRRNYRCRQRTMLDWLKILI